MSTTKDTRKLAHGLTETELEQLRLDQIDGTVKMAKTKKGYSFPAHEAHLVHAEIHRPDFDPQTGEDKGSKFVQKFYPNEFKRMQGEQAFAGLKVTVVHSPDKMEDVEPFDHLKPQMIGGKEAGTPTDPNAPKADWKKLSVETLQAAREVLVADGKSETIKDHAKLVKDVQEALEKQGDAEQLKTMEHLTALATEANKDAK